LLPLALGILGTWALLWLFGKKGGDTTRITEIESLLTTRDRELKDRDAELGNLRAQLKNVEGEYKGAMSNREKYELDLKAADKKYLDLNARATALENDLKAAVSARGKLEADLKAKDGEATSLSSRLSALMGEVDKSKAGLAAQIAALTAGAATAAAAIKGKDAELADWKARFGKLELDLKAANDARTKLDADLKAKGNVDTEIVGLRGQLDKTKTSLAAQIAALTAGAATAAATLKSRDTEIADWKARFGKLELDLKAANDARAKLDADLKAKGGVDTELTGLRAQFASLKGDADKAKAAAAAELAALTAGAATAAATIKSKDTRIAELEAQYKKLQADFGAKAGSDKELADLRARIAKLEADLKAGMDAKAKAEADRDIRLRELEDLRKRLASTQGDLDKAKGAAAAELAALTAGAATAAATLRSKDSRISDLEKRISSLEGELSGARSGGKALADAQAEIAALRGQMTKAQADWDARLLARENEWKAKLASTEGQYKTQLMSAQAAVVDAQKTRTAAEAAAAKLGVKAVVSACPQHLSDTKGIGTVFEGRLYANGIGTFFELANMSDDDLKKALQITDEMVSSVSYDEIRKDALRLARETNSLGRTWSGQSPDDFEPIDGIGYTFEKRLYDANICTYEALLNTPQDKIFEIVTQGKKLVNKPDIPYWIKQVKDLMKK
jgi:chromosome segregation ATPase